MEDTRIEREVAQEITYQQTCFRGVRCLPLLGETHSSSRALFENHFTTLETRESGVS